MIDKGDFMYSNGFTDARTYILSPYLKYLKLMYFIFMDTYEAALEESDHLSWIS